ncbi:uncharacterized protein [Amphiura filiformis]|uniref:uncharacterized protein n=1 Tax=Amphiura filiformis TaxID=82378 RepID=UPI003B2142B0
MSLPNKAGSTGSSVAFARVKSLEDYITSHILKQLSMKNLWQDDKFNDEYWIKIGGDKGGCSTKLTMQLVNQREPNSRDSTNIIAMFNGTDTTENMQKVYGLYNEQLANLQKKKTIVIEGAVKCLRTFFLETMKHSARVLAIWAQLLHTHAFGAT